MIATVKRYWITLLLLGMGALFLTAYALGDGFRPNSMPTTISQLLPTPTPTKIATATATATATAMPTPITTPQSLIPSPTVTATAVNEADPIVTPTATSFTPTPVAETSPTTTATAAATSAPSIESTVGTISFLERFGVADGYRQLIPAYQAGLRFGSYLNWGHSSEPMRGVTYFQMVRVGPDGLESSYDTLAQVIADQPGSIFLIGNEPDVRIQDNVPPAQYAIAYHDIYAFIKARDPSALVAIGGVSQSTPLRRAYLDIVLDTYRSTYGEPLPVDIFNIHGFILREEQGNWGVGIPPGMDGWTGTLYEVEDHDDITIFQQNIVDFRAWMAARGYGDKPLIVSEYGILMPAEYGFPPESVANFMTSSFDFFLSAANGNGYAADGGRLVQWWVWYSVHDPVEFPTSNLYDAETGQLTPLGRIFSDYVQ